MARAHSSTPAQRTQWVAELIAHAGDYGVVTALSQAAQVSRQSLYTWRAVGLEALTTAFSLTQAAPAVSLNVERAILTLWAEGHASCRGIQRCLQSLHQRRVSLETISAVLAAAQRRALAWFARQCLPSQRAIALDEMYGHDRHAAYLSIVDAHSGAVWATASGLNVDAESWTLVLWDAQDHGLTWHTTVSDGERAITEASTTLQPERRPQRDVWHVLHRCAQVQGRLQRRVVALRQQALTVARQAQRLAAGQRPLGRVPQSDVVAHTARLDAATRVAGGLHVLGQELKRLLEVVVLERRRGVLTSGMRGQDLDAWLELLADLRDTAPTEAQPDLKALHTYVRLALPDLLTFARDLDAVQAATSQAVGEPGLALVGWAWQRRRQLAPSREALLGGLATDWRPAAARVMAAWDAAVRTSSAAENWHSILRPHLAVHRHLSTGMVALLAVWHNHRVFPRGVHKGYSPLHLSGLTQASTDWLVALGYPPAEPADGPRLTLCPNPSLALAA